MSSFVLICHAASTRINDVISSKTALMVLMRIFVVSPICMEILTWLIHLQVQKSIGKFSERNLHCILKHFNYSYTFYILLILNTVMLFLLCILVLVNQLNSRGIIWIIF